MRPVQTCGVGCLISAALRVVINLFPNRPRISPNINGNGLTTNTRLTFKLAFQPLLLAALLTGAIPERNDAAVGDLYVADTNGIWKVTPAGTKSIFASGLIGASNLAFDKSGNLFALDRPSKTLYKFTPAGARSTFATFNMLSVPSGLAFDSKGNLFVGELVSGVIFKFTDQGIRTNFASGAGGSSGLAFDHNGDLFVSASNSVLKYTPAALRTTFVTGLNGPFGLAFDSKGLLFVSDKPIGTILSFTPGGVASPPFGLGITDPAGLAFDGKGNLYVANTTGNSILKFTPAGNRTTFATGFNNPSYLAFEPAPTKLRNLSTRGLVQAGEDVLIGGFIVGGNALINNPVVVRAIGPSLSHFGIAHPLQDPTLELHNTSGVVASNNNWKDTQQVSIQASGLAPTDVRESAIIATLPAGNYTAIVRGANNTTGIALVEVYNVR